MAERLSKFERQIRKLRGISSDISRHDDRMVRALREAFPEGSYVEFRKAANQINPSRGTVTGHCGGEHGYIVVRYSNTGNRVTVCFSDIRRCTPPEQPLG